jgi:pyrimidine operon attenuation protein/uracil phosphoribosyltransferase
MIVVNFECYFRSCRYGKAFLHGRKEMKFKAQLMTSDEMERALKRMSHQILERNDGAMDVVLLGIRRRGVPLAEKLAENIRLIEGAEVPVGELDITLYRDDLSELGISATVNETRVDFPIEGKIVVLVDDVIYTGRTARAALDACSELGRAARIQLAALIDRGHRELPIRADYVGKNVPTSKDEVISVMVDRFDGQTCVNLYQKDSKEE